MLDAEASLEAENDALRTELLRLKASLVLILELADRGSGYLPQIIDRIAVEASDALGWSDK